ncbi:MAG: hypothetical protein NTW21_23945 [Verrucomicrobia bacterium]|nr:hypothetical protein [Verrucomicrobiota bacterium]
MSLLTENTAASVGQVAGTANGNGVQAVVVTLTGAPLTAPKLFVQVRAD